MSRCKECVAWQFGVCHFKDYCLPEREALMEQAETLAVERGHELGEFSRLADGLSLFRAVCLHCGRSVTIDVNPGADEIELFGEALTEPCDAQTVPTSPPPAGGDVT